MWAANQITDRSHPGPRFLICVTPHPPSRSRPSVMDQRKADCLALGWGGVGRGGRGVSLGRGAELRIWGFWSRVDALLSCTWCTPPPPPGWITVHKFPSTAPPLFCPYPRPAVSGGPRRVPGCHPVPPAILPKPHFPARSPLRLNPSRRPLHASSSCLASVPFLPSSR